MCNFTLAARGASVVFGVEYANDLDTPIHKRTYVRPAQFIYVVYVRLSRRKVVPAIRRRRSRLEIFIFYVVCVSRSRIGLDVIYVHVETNDVLATSFEAMHTGICTQTAHAPFVQNVNHVRSS